MRLLLILTAVALAGLLSACNSAGDYGNTFSTSNYRMENDPNGTQRRMDVNRAYTAPVRPTFGNTNL